MGKMQAEGSLCGDVTASFRETQHINSICTATNSLASVGDCPKALGKVEGGGRCLALSESRPIGLLDLEQDCLQAIMALVGSPAAALRFAGTCRTMQRVLRDAGPEAPLFRELALRNWSSTFADVRTYGGDWQQLCLDDNARNAVASKCLNVPVSALQWPEDSVAQYRPYRAEVTLVDCTFQISVGFLFQQDRRHGITLDVAFEVTSGVQRAPLPVHILVTLNRKHPHVEPSDEEDPARHMFSTFCSFSSSNTLLLFKNLASCSTLLTERLGYVYDSVDDSCCQGKGTGESVSGHALKHIQLKIDVLRMWDPHSRISSAGGASSSRRRVPVISCNCGPTADLCCPESAIKAVLRRCWSRSPQVRDVAWRYLWHLVSTARLQQQDKLERFCKVLAALGAVKLLLTACADSDLEVATTALQIICTMADIEASAMQLQQDHAIEVMTQVNLNTKQQSIRRATGEAIASLVPLDAEGLAIIRSLKLL